MQNVREIRNLKSEILTIYHSMSFTLANASFVGMTKNSATKLVIPRGGIYSALYF